ncbi:unnamed protein product, partial [Prorocentrum cordatum]
VAALYGKSEGVDWERWMLLHRQWLGSSAAERGAWQRWRPLLEQRAAGEAGFRRALEAFVQSHRLSVPGFQEGDLLVRGRLNLCRAGLRGLDLRGAPLAGACLVQADLSGANLDGAHLAGADLTGATLCGARLAGACLAGACLELARLDGAVLDGAACADAVFTRASLRGASLRGCVARGAALKDACLQGAHLQGADLAGCCLRNASLRRARLDQRTHLAGARMRGALLDGARIPPWPVPADGCAEPPSDAPALLGAAAGDEDPAADSLAGPALEPDEAGDEGEPRHAEGDPLLGGPAAARGGAAALEFCRLPGLYSRAPPESSALLAPPEPIADRLVRLEDEMRKEAFAVHGRAADQLLFRVRELSQLSAARLAELQKRLSRQGPRSLPRTLARGGQK